jgi:single-stranded-DNA-specific exonuclease
MSDQRPWHPYPEAPVSSEILAMAKGYPLIAQYFSRRGLRSPQEVHAYLDPDQHSPSPPSALPGMERAVERLRQAVKAKERICVWGDFDVDGQTATTILVSTLRQLDAQVRYHIPIRDVESHGIRLSNLQEEIDSGLDLLLTCDTGIAANEAIQAAASQGVQTIITDHHALPMVLPPAYAIVTPRLLDDPAHPLAALPGVGVAYKLVEALFDRFGRPQASLEYLDLVALGIVADVASLVGDSRYLLQLGLRQLQHPTRPALQALYEIADIKPGSINEETIAFALAPRLNAVGRLSDANPMVEFFITSNDSEARIQAQVIEGLNMQRKLLTDQVFKSAMSQVERDPALLETSALVLSYPTWPAGVIGIIASRLVEYFHKPVVLLSTPPGEPARGSARSVPGINITQAIASQADLLLGFGGHPMAAGLSLQPDHIPEFRQGLSQAIDIQVTQRTDQEEDRSALFFDAYHPFASLSLEFVEQLERLAPFGLGNPSPILVAQNVTIDSTQAVGLHDEHLILHLLDSNKLKQDVIWWQAGSLSSAPGFELPEGPFDLAYTVHSRDFKGQRSIQVEWLDHRFGPLTDLSIQSQAVTRELIDYRNIPSPLDKLQELLSQSALQVWQEGPAPVSIPSSDRFHLQPGPALAIWTIPPGRAELVAAIEKVQPQVIYFFSAHPGLSQLALFIERLSGMVKFALPRSAQPIPLASLATALAHQLSTVRLGLAWLEHRGLITCDFTDEDQILLGRGLGESAPGLKQVEANLKASLDETEAFRLFYLRQNLDRLL